MKMKAIEIEFKRFGLLPTAVAFLSLLALCHGKTPDAELHLSDGTLLRATYGNFGSRATFTDLNVDMAQEYYKLCNVTPPAPLPFSRNDILLIPRGGCSFEKKAHNAWILGAAGVVIYNTLESRYRSNSSGAVIYPEEYNDYDCSNGAMTLENVPFELDPPTYHTAVHDDYLMCQVVPKISVSCRRIRVPRNDVLLQAKWKTRMIRMKLVVPGIFISACLRILK